MKGEKWLGNTSNRKKEKKLLDNSIELFIVFLRWRLVFT